jgi:hypothetical protein
MILVKFEEPQFSHLKSIYGVLKLMQFLMFNAGTNTNFSQKQAFGVYLVVIYLDCFLWLRVQTSVEAFLYLNRLK